MMNSIKEWTAKHKNEIVVGVIVFFLTSLLSWLGHWMITAGPSKGKSILSSMRDLVFYNAAHQSVFSIILFLLLLLFIVYFTYIIITAFRAISLTQKTIDLQEIESICESLNNEEMDKASKQSKAIEAKIKLEKLKKKFKQKPDPNPKNQKKSLHIYLLFIIIYLLYMIFYVFIPAILWNGFDITITQVSPYTEESEIIVLRSQWVSMKTYEDFCLINDRLLEIRQENNLVN